MANKALIKMGERNNNINDLLDSADSSEEVIVGRIRDTIKIEGTIPPEGGIKRKVRELHGRKRSQRELRKNPS